MTDLLPETFGIGDDVTVLLPSGRQRDGRCTDIWNRRVNVSLDDGGPKTYPIGWVYPWGQAPEMASA